MMAAAPLLGPLTLVGLAVLAINIGLCTVRAVIGPSPFDRIMALECITFNISGAVVLVSLGLGTGVFMDFLLVVALLGFIGTVALTAYVERTLGA
jgi:multisubunit Na+/H+ antiporter MnhF subunit